MGDGTGISWTDATWNPVRGCSRVSEGCRHCYAESIAARFSGPGQPYEGLAKIGVRTGHHPKWTGEVRFIPEHLADPLRWRKPRRIFVNSMSDLFHEKLTNEQIAIIFGVMGAARQHTFQVLTKRARRMREWFEWALGSGGPDICELTCTALDAAGFERGCGSAFDHLEDWPLPNVWLGVSVENQDAADDRIPHLLTTPAAVRFLSCEPLLGSVDLHAIQIPEVRDGLRFSALQRHHDDRFGQSDIVLDWVIAGCESGRGARACEVGWLRFLRDQCATAGVPFFLKQAAVGLGDLASDKPEPRPIDIGAGSKWKPGNVIELPYLDGVQHAAFPEVRA
jgi:protein gp37